MKKRLVAMGLIAAFAATGAVAATSQHFATASTKKEAKRLATVEARAIALKSGVCFRPAYQVAECDKVEGGFRCRADSANDFRTCRRSGWLSDRGPQAFQRYAYTLVDPYYDRLRYTNGPYSSAPYAHLPQDHSVVVQGWRPTEPVVIPPISFARN